MPQTVSDKIADLKALLLQAQPIMVFGADFMAFNYGDGAFAGGRDSLVTSNFGHARVNRSTGRWSFSTVPNVSIPEASHFNAGRKEIDLLFLQAKEEIEKQ